MVLELEASRSALSDQALRYQQELDSLQVCCCPSLRIVLFTLCKSKYDGLKVETGRLRAAPEVTQQRLEETISKLEELKMRSELKIPLLQLKIQELTDSERDARQSAQSVKAALEGLQVSFGLIQLCSYLTSYLTLFTGTESKRQGFFLLSHSRIGKGKCCLLHERYWKLGFPGKLAVPS